MITVFGAPPTRALRVLWMLEEMNLPYEFRPVDFRTRFADADFMRASPAGAIPAIRDGDVDVFESCAILEYLGAAKFSDCEERLEPPLRDYSARLRQRPAFGRAMSKAQPVA